MPPPAVAPRCQMVVQYGQQPPVVVRDRRLMDIIAWLLAQQDCLELDDYGGSGGKLVIHWGAGHLGGYLERHLAQVRTHE